MTRTTRRDQTREARERFESRISAGIVLGLLIFGGIFAAGSTLETGSRTVTLSDTPVAPALASDAGKGIDKAGEPRAARVIAIHRS